VDRHAAPPDEGAFDRIAHVGRLSTRSTAACQPR
jgi:hypothetical protein